MLLILGLSVLLCRQAHGCMNGLPLNGDGTKPIPQQDNLVFLDNTEIGPYPSDGPPVVDVSTLNCGFGANPFPPSSQCSWRNIEPPADQFDWMRARFTRAVDPTLFQTFTGKREVPNGDFLFVGEPRGRSAQDTAVLQADIPCQRGPGLLTFDLWSSSLRPEVRVCTMGSDFVSRSCQLPINRHSPNPIQFEIPDQGGEPFQLRIEANGFSEPSIVMIDNIQYETEICADDGGDGNGGGPIGSCGYIECDFNQGTTCAYNTRGDGSRNGQWNLGVGRIGNPATGIQRGNPKESVTKDNKDFHGGYAFVGRDQIEGNQDAVYVLESPQFTLTEPATVVFDLYRRSVGPIFEMCSNSNCYFSTEDVPLDPRKYWDTHQVTIDQGTRTIQFIVKNLDKNQWFALDNISVSPGLTTSNPNICVQPSFLSFNRAFYKK